MLTNGSVAIAGELGLRVIRGENSRCAIDDIAGPPPNYPSTDQMGVLATLATIIEHGLPKAGLSEEVNRWRRSNTRNLMRGARRVLAAKKMGIAHPYGALWGRVIKGNGEVIDLGLMSLRVVTTAGVNKLVACMNAGDTTTFTTFKYHGFGTGTTNESSSDTALVTELTTEYATNSTRPTGTQTTGGSSNVYRSVATLSPDSGGVLAITEHGLFSANASGTLWDRSKFSAYNLDSAAGDSLQVTYDCTFAAGS